MDQEEREERFLSEAVKDRPERQFERHISAKAAAAAVASHGLAQGTEELHSRLSKAHAARLELSHEKSVGRVVQDHAAALSHDMHALAAATRSTATATTT